MSSELNNKQICDLPTDGTCSSITDMLELGDCYIPAGACFTAPSVIVDEHGHPIDGDWKKDKNGEWVLSDGKCEHVENLKQDKKLMNQNDKNTDTEIDTSTEMQTVASVEQIHQDPIIPQKKDVMPDTTITLVVSILSGIIGNAAAPLFKNLLKKLFKKNIKEEKNDEITDCKTHQVSTNVKFSSLENRVASLEGRVKEENDFGIDFEEISDLKSRIEKLEKKKK